ncbi:MAG: hypothetical protein WAS36_04650 [Candidatus Saccharimonadales bacterium]
MNKLQQKGIGHLVLLVTVIVVLIVGLAGYIVMNAQDNKAANETSEQATPQQAEQVELTQSSDELNSVNDDLDQSLDTTELDKDIDAML